MKTIIELYDDRPIENVLASEVFRPERTVFLCPAEIAQDKNKQKKLRDYFAHCGLENEVVFLESSLYYSDKVLKQLRAITEKYEECVIDITGGTDAALFACGRLCAERDIPAFTYSRKRNCFFNIHNADFAEELPCEVLHSVEDCFLMAGGALREGKVDNSALSGYIDVINSFFGVYLKHRSQWKRAIEYVQIVSHCEKGQAIPLSVESKRVVKGERGSLVEVPEACLYDLEMIGFLSDVQIEGDSVSFSFVDQQMRLWLRDVGSVLELYVYKACLDAGVFNDVRTSAVVDWEGDFSQDSVTNEIDVMAMMGVLPAFFSCKTCEINTGALNELAVLRDRFGGHGAKAAAVTTQYCRSITRRRASELNIDIIDINDIKSGRLIECILSMMNRR